KEAIMSEDSANRPTEQSVQGSGEPAATGEQTPASGEPKSRMARKFAEKRHAIPPAPGSPQPLQAFVAEDLPEDAGRGRGRDVEDVKKPKRAEPTGRRLRRLLDEDIESELEQALGQFDE